MVCGSHSIHSQRSRTISRNPQSSISFSLSRCQTHTLHSISTPAPQCTLHINITITWLFFDETEKLLEKPKHPVRREIVFSVLHFRPLSHLAFSLYLRFRKMLILKQIIKHPSQVDSLFLHLRVVFLSHHRL